MLPWPEAPSGVGLRDPLGTRNPLHISSMLKHPVASLYRPGYRAANAADTRQRIRPFAPSSKGLGIVKKKPTILSSPALTLKLTLAEKVVNLTTQSTKASLDKIIDLEGFKSIDIVCLIDRGRGGGGKWI